MGRFDHPRPEYELGGLAEAGRCQVLLAELGEVHVELRIVRLR